MQNTCLRRDRVIMSHLYSHHLQCGALLSGTLTSSSPIARPQSETTTKTTTLDTQPATGTREAIGFCAFAGVSWIAACLCFNTGLAGMSSAGVANGISVVVQTLAIFVASWFLFGESINDLKQIAGITLMMFGMVLVNWK
eukprot:m.121687 g.121687  ORF g.121687 m.121687 type:complete len:140 (+) comp13391_c0_seq1:1426-1845(+)